MRLLVVVSVVWSVGVLLFLLINPALQGSGDPAPPALVSTER